MWTVTKNGTISIHYVTFQVSYAHAGQDIRALVKYTGVMFVDT